MKKEISKIVSLSGLKEMNKNDFDKMKEWKKKRNTEKYVMIWYLS